MPGMAVGSNLWGLWLTGALPVLMGGQQRGKEAGAQRKSLSWQGWQYILSARSRKEPLCSWPRQ